MDSISDASFYRLFKRTSEIVNLRGAKTPAEVNKRLLAKINQYPPRLSSGWSAFLKRLIPGFGRRSIDEAISNPNGLVALTLKQGPETAKMILAEQTRKYSEYLRKKAKRKKYRRKK